MVRVIGICFVCLLFVVTGCDSGPSRFPATGTVSFEGKPLEGATVTFVPDGGPIGSALTDASGKFSITSDGKPGTPAGNYKVTVAKSAPNASMPAAPTPEDMKKGVMAGNIAAKPLIPIQYSTVQGSGLTATVTSDAANNSYTFELK